MITLKKLLNSELNYQNFLIKYVSFLKKEIDFMSICLAKLDKRDSKLI